MTHSLRFICPHCDARLTAPPNRAGSRHKCPKCHSDLDIPAADAAPTDSPLLDPAPADAQPAAATVYIPVICHLCHTRMYATAAQVGGKIKCPDCGRSTTVPPPPVVRKNTIAPVPSEADEYTLAPGVDQPASDSPSQRQQILVTCHLCQTRMHATLDQVGAMLVCPDCGRSTKVPPPPAPEKKRKLVDRGEELRMSAPVEREVIDSDLDRLIQAASNPATVAGDLPKGWIRAEPTVPRWPFLSGVFTFPFYRGTVLKWVKWSLMLAVIVYVLGGAVELGLQPAAGIATSGSWIMSLMLSIVTVVIGLFCLVSGASGLLAIVQDTANGVDAIENWPDVVWMDYLFDALYLVSALLVSGLPGLGIYVVWQSLGDPSSLCMTVSVMVCFPLVLLSMLEAGSFLTPLTWPILRSTFVVWWAWGLFYLETSLFGAAVLAVAWTMLRYGRVAAILPVAALLMALLIVYFRLLGRLAWVCAIRAARQPPSGDEELASGE